METIDAKIFALLAGLTTALVGALKKAFPAWMTGKEPLLAIVTPVVLVVAFKVSGLLKGTEWPEAVIWAIGAGIGSQLIHDKILDGVVKNKELKSK